MLKFFDADPDPGIFMTLDPGYGMEKFRIRGPFRNTASYRLYYSNSISFIFISLCVSEGFKVAPRCKNVIYIKIQPMLTYESSVNDGICFLQVKPLRVTSHEGKQIDRQIQYNRVSYHTVY